MLKVFVIAVAAFIFLWYAYQAFTGELLFNI